MSAAHVAQMVALLSFEEEPTTLLSDYGFAEADCAAIGDEWELAPEDSYCPFSDVPDGIAVGSIAQVGADLWAVGATNMCGFATRMCFKFIKK